MNTDDIKQHLQDIAEARPMLWGLLRKNMKQGTGEPPKSLGMIWVGILADETKTKQTYLADVLGEFADRKRMVPDPIDSLCDVIQAEANARYWRAWERHQQHMKYHRRPTRDFADDELGRFYELWNFIDQQPNLWRERRQALTDKQMDEGTAWVRGKGERPAWLQTSSR